MKILYILILCTFISCSQKAKENKYTGTITEGAVEIVRDTPKKENILSFKDVINNTKTRPIPLLEATNFDSFIEEGDYKMVEEEVLKLAIIYPNFYNKGYNYKAIASYRLELSNKFHSLVVTILKGDHEMESTLINYDLNGLIIDSKVVSYDEIAEGMSKIESKIEQNELIVNNIFWTDNKQVETKSFQILANGKFEAVSQEESLLNSVIQQLNLEQLKINKDFVSTKIQPHNSNETIVVIPEIGLEAEDIFELNSYILLVNNITKKITHKYIESSNTNGWISDAIILSKIAIDTAPYIVSENTRAFGIQVYHYGMSRPNPYSNKTISLFVKSGDSLKKVLHNYDIVNSRGEWDTNCAGEFTDVKSTLIFSSEKTNGYFDILVKSKITESKAYIDENGDCDAKDKITTKTNWLKFNGEEYKNNRVITTLEVYLNAPDPNGVNIRKEPNGKTILNLNKQDEYFILKITEAKNGWFKVIHVKGAEVGLIKIPGEIGWIHNSCIIEAGTRQDITLIDKPQAGNMVGAIGVENQVIIKDKYFNWVKIEYKELTGWVESKWLCGNPFTTCP